jgi:hypothetical protein
VSQSKFIVLKIISRKIFGEFIEVFLKGLNPFKIHIKFELEFASGIFNSNSIGCLDFFPKGKLFLLN